MSATLFFFPAVCSAALLELVEIGDLSLKIVNTKLGVLGQEGNKIGLPVCIV